MRTFVSLSVLAQLGLAATCAWSADGGDVLHKCTAIDSPGERLACYDKLAGRVSHAAATTASAPGTTTGASSVGTGLTTSSPGGSASIPTPPSDKPLGKQTFGLYSAEHPAAPPGYPELTAAVTKVGPGPNGDM